MDELSWEARGGSGARRGRQEAAPSAFRVLVCRPTVPRVTTANPGDTPPPRPVAASKVEMTEIVFPNDANPLGNAMGGRVMHWIDICAAVCAGRHARTPVVTANVDHIDFLNPVPVGGIVVLLASVNFAGRSS